MDVVVWLRSLGLGKYEALFHENDIDETVLPNLTAEDLKELGVASLGHRRKLLDAIAALRTDASGKAPSVDVAATSTGPRDGSSCFPDVCFVRDCLCPHPLWELHGRNRTSQGAFFGR